MKSQKARLLLALVLAGSAGCGDDGGNSGPDAGEEVIDALDVTDVSLNDAYDATDTDGDVDPDSSDAADSDDGSDSEDGSSEGVLSGVAAVGAPLATANVTLTCADASASATGTTTSTGSFTLDVAPNSGPCALKVEDNGQTFYSFSATGNGVANITPLTDLALSLALSSAGKGTAAEWFASPSDWAVVAAEIASGTQTLVFGLLGSGFVIPTNDVNFDPFGAPFEATAGDPWDNLLEDIADSIAADESVADHAAFLALLAAGSDLPDAPDGYRAIAMTGDGAALEGQAGATMTLGDQEYVFKASGETGANVVYGALGLERLNFQLEAYEMKENGSLDYLRFIKVIDVPKVVGTYDCRTDNSFPLVRLGNGRSGIDPAACVIEILEVTDLSVTGRFSGVFGSIAVSDGYFAQYLDYGSGEPLADGEEGVSFDVEGDTYNYPLSNSLAFEEFIGMNGRPETNNSPGSPNGIQLHTIPNAVGTYQCDEPVDGDSYRKTNVWFFWYGTLHHAGNRQNPTPGPAGTSCTINVTSVGDTFEGTFSGTFGNDDGEIVVTNGRFRYFAD